MDDAIPLFFEPFIRGPKAKFSTWECPADGHVTMHVGVARPTPEMLEAAADKPWPVGSPAVDNSNGTWTGPELCCVGGTIELPPQEESLSTDGYQRGDFVLRHDGTSEEIELHFRFRTAEPADDSHVPIDFMPVAMADGCSVRFSASMCARDSQVEIDAVVNGAGVFAPSELRPLEYRHDGWIVADGVLAGPCLRVEGATLAATDVSQGADRGRFTLSHDGTSERIVVSFATQTTEPQWKRKGRRGFVPIRYVPVRPGMRMQFDNGQVQIGGRTLVNAKIVDAAGGTAVHNSVLAASRITDADGAVSVAAAIRGDVLTCEGGTIETWAADIEQPFGESPWGTFAVTHDGVSDEIVVTYGTRMD